MSTAERWAYLIALDEELLKGGVIVSEWCSFIVRESDTASEGGAHLASILTAVAGIETYLRAKYAVTGKEKLVELIEGAPIGQDLKADLHALRRYRNRWVHVDEPWDDQRLIEQPEAMKRELEDKAFFAARVLRRTLYSNQWV